MLNNLHYTQAVKFDRIGVDTSGLFLVEIVSFYYCTVQLGHNDVNVYGTIIVQ